jgi:hypothetical protein
VTSRTETAQRSTFTAPAAMPRTNQRPEAKYTTSGTSAVSMVAAMSTLYARSP